MNLISLIGCRTVLISPIQMMFDADARDSLDSDLSRFGYHLTWLLSDLVIIRFGYHQI